MCLLLFVKTKLQLKKKIRLPFLPSSPSSRWKIKYWITQTKALANNFNIMKTTILAVSTAVRYAIQNTSGGRISICLLLKEASPVRLWIPQTMGSPMTSAKWSMCQNKASGFWPYGPLVWHYEAFWPLAALQVFVLGGDLFSALGVKPAYFLNAILIQTFSRKNK